jgi:hypothetical protein
MRNHPTIKDFYVSDDGRVFRELGTEKGHGGYHVVSSKARHGVRRHVIVCEAFHGERPSKDHVVRHKNGNPGDDRPENLEWGTQADNMMDMVLHGNSTFGAKNPMAKVSPEKVMEIRNRWASGESPTRLAEEFGISQPGVQDIVRGRTWSSLPLVKREKRE